MRPNKPPGRNMTDERIERAAEAIFTHPVFGRGEQGEKPAWVPGGNSHMQWIARAFARKAIESAEDHPTPTDHLNRAEREAAYWREMAGKLAGAGAAVVNYDGEGATGGIQMMRRYQTAIARLKSALAEYREAVK